MITTNNFAILYVDVDLQVHLTANKVIDLYLYLYIFIAVLALCGRPILPKM